MNDLLELQNYLRRLGPVAVAVSGGVDSMTLSYIAHRVNPATRLFHAVSPAVPHQATARVKSYAKREGWNLEIIDAGEIEDPDYRANPANRCYYCKTHLYDAIAELTDLPLVSGTNTDDLGDYRPGLVAAKEHQVLHPYVETNISKLTLRKIASSLGLTDLSDLPAAPCLSSRVTTGITIDPALLPLINNVEQTLWQLLGQALPLKAVRCRVRPGELVIELDSDTEINQDSGEIDKAIESARSIFLAAGYHEYTQSISIEPYQRGSAFLIETLQVD